MEEIVKGKYSEYIRKILQKASDEIILPLYGNLRKKQIFTKSSKNDLVTEADKLAEIFIKSSLFEISENYNFIGEESYNSKTIKNIEKSSSPYTWTCDPIDGTYNYVNNVDKFCSMITLCKNKIPKFSWIYFPVFNVFCYCISSDSIFITYKNNKIRINRQNQKINIISISGSMKFLDYLFKDYQTKKDSFGLVTSKNIKCAGFEVIALACNKIDYLIQNKLTPWDHSPVYNFAYSSGCRVILNNSDEKFKFDSKGQLVCISSNLAYNKLLKNI